MNKKETKKEIIEGDVNIDINEVSQKKEKPKKSKLKGFLVTIVQILVMFTIVFCILKYVAQLVTVVGDSMNPTYEDGNLLLMEKITKNYEINDVVIFNSTVENKVLVKRVVAVAGDTVQIKEGYLYVNDEKIVDEHSESIMNESGYLINRLIVEEGYYFVLGDNRNNSLDSRFIGCISQEEIMGKIIVLKS